MNDAPRDVRLISIMGYIRVGRGFVAGAKQALRSTLSAPFNRAPNRIRLRRGYRFAGEEGIDGIAEVFDLHVVGVLVVIVHLAVVTEDALFIEDKKLGCVRCAERFGDGLAFIA